MKTIGLVLILILIQVYTIKTDVTRNDVIDYLVNYGYLETQNCTKYELKKSLRQVQRENNITVNGKIDSNIRNLVQKDKDKTIIINYLKTFGYLRGEINPLILKDAIKLLQKNSGVLNVTGSIDTSTLNFIISHPQGYSEAILQ